MEHFVTEAKAAAALNQPNIAPIYEIGDSEGTPFIAMEDVDGVTRREEYPPLRGAAGSAFRLPRPGGARARQGASRPARLPGCAHADER